MWYLAAKPLQEDMTLCYDVADHSCGCPRRVKGRTQKHVHAHNELLDQIQACVREMSSNVPNCPPSPRSHCQAMRKERVEGKGGGGGGAGGGGGSAGGGGHRHKTGVAHAHCESPGLPNPGM